MKAESTNRGLSTPHAANFSTPRGWFFWLLLKICSHSFGLDMFGYLLFFEDTIWFTHPKKLNLQSHRGCPQLHGEGVAPFDMCFRTNLPILWLHLQLAGKWRQDTHRWLRRGSCMIRVAKLWLVAMLSWLSIWNLPNSLCWAAQPNLSCFWKPTSQIQRIHKLPIIQLSFGEYAVASFWISPLALSVVGTRNPQNEFGVGSNLQILQMQKRAAFMDWHVVNQER